MQRLATSRVRKNTKTGTDLFFDTDFPKSIRKIDLSRFFEVYVGVLLVSRKHPLPLFTA
jgi:hypothetical protein